MRNLTRLFITLFFMTACVFFFAGCSDSIPAALKETFAAAKKGDADAALTMALAYIHGEKGLKKDDKKAFGWLEKSALENNIEANYLLGKAYRDGIGTVQNQPKAIEHFTIAAKAKHPKAAFDLATLYKRMRNLKEAQEWFEKAALMDDIDSMKELVQTFCFTRPVDANKCVYWLKKLADKKFTYYMRELAKIYIAGEIVPASKKDAFYWFNEAAKLGDAQAMYAISRSYKNGAFTQRNEKEAAIWLARASEHGHEAAAYDLSQQTTKEKYSPLPKYNEQVAIAAQSKGAAQGATQKTAAAKQQSSRVSTGPKAAPSAKVTAKENNLVTYQISYDRPLESLWDHYYKTLKKTDSLSPKEYTNKSYAAYIVYFYDKSGNAKCQTSISMIKEYTGIIWQENGREYTSSAVVSANGLAGSFNIEQFVKQYFHSKNFPITQNSINMDYLAKLPQCKVSTSTLTTALLKRKMDKYDKSSDIYPLVMPELNLKISEAGITFPISIYGDHRSDINDAEIIIDGAARSGIFRSAFEVQY
ncbi:TPR repeat protein/galactitol-specific phosphotransferase system IIB component [Elusimicrobium posterum]|uniref:tetratricopeptide repeat protein n=1 Tax=Elusimicrobium posterum TaxID=3116653 RepID=UPI003C738F21